MVAPPPRQKIEKSQKFPGASPPDPPKKRKKSNFTSTKMLKNSLCQLILNYIKASFVNIEKSISWEKVSKGGMNNYWDHEPEFFGTKKMSEKVRNF